MIKLVLFMKEIYLLMTPNSISLECLSGEFCINSPVFLFLKITIRIENTDMNCKNEAAMITAPKLFEDTAS